MMSATDVGGLMLAREAAKSEEIESVIDFDQYDEQAFDVEWAAPRSVITTDVEEGESFGAAASTTGFSGPGKVGAEDIKDMIPSSILKTFDPDSPAQAMLSEEEALKKSAGTSVLKALVKAITKALNGDSVVTAPAFHRGIPWLGSIEVKPGSLKGPLFAKHRTYKVQAQILAGGHVLPWTIGREWRYSELRKVLVDDLQLIVRKHDLEKHYTSLFDTFPPKTWQNRNNEDTAEFRGYAIQSYINNVIRVTNKVIEDIEAKKNSSKKKKRTSLPSDSGSTGTSYTTSQLLHSMGYASDGSKGSESGLTAARKSSFDAIAGEALGEIIDLLVSKLLNLNRHLRNDISQLSTSLGTIITSSPTDHCHVTKEFKITPQQAL